jgi:hypothetical protein
MKINIYENIIDELLEGFIRYKFKYSKDMVIEFNVAQYVLVINQYDLMYIEEKTTLPRDELRAFYHLIRLRKSKDYNFFKEWAERISILKFVKNYSINVISIMKYESPDFIINYDFGIEILNYMTEKYALLEQFLNKRKNIELSQKEMKRILGSKEYEEMLDVMMPTIDVDEDTILAYSVPGLNISDINVRKRFFVDEIIGKKMQKYSEGKYQKFNQNYLVVSTQFASCIEATNGYNVVEEINKKYPKVREIYDLKIIVLDLFSMIEINLGNVKTLKIKSFIR